MKTYPHITSKLERGIVASALFTLRKININTTCKWFVYMSATLSGIPDACWVDSETGKLDHICYSVWEGKSTVGKVIYLTPIIK